MSPRPNWDPPSPSLASECAPPPGTGGGGGTLACGWGVGGVPIPTTGEKAQHSAYSVTFSVKYLIGIGIKGRLIDTGKF
jgi:hypothetical protein